MAKTNQTTHHNQIGVRTDSVEPAGTSGYQATFTVWTPDNGNAYDVSATILAGDVQPIIVRRKGASRNTARSSKVYAAICDAVRLHVGVDHADRCKRCGGKVLTEAEHIELAQFAEADAAFDAGEFGGGSHAYDGICECHEDGEQDPDDEWAPELPEGQRVVANPPPDYVASPEFAAAVANRLVHLDPEPALNPMVEQSLATLDAAKQAIANCGLPVEVVTVSGGPPECVRCGNTASPLNEKGVCWDCRDRARKTRNRRKAQRRKLRRQGIRL